MPHQDANRVGARVIGLAESEPKQRDWRRGESSKCFAIREEFGGRDRDRTGDPCLQIQKSNLDDVKKNEKE